MNGIQIFENKEFGEIRTIMLEGEPWFVAKDISDKLGYTKTFNMMKRIDEDDKQNISSSILEEQIGEQSYTIGVVNESGLYAAAFGSKLESAKRFRRWVTSEVLPSIRKTGTYGQPQLPKSNMELLQLHYEALKEVDQKVDHVDSRVDGIKADLEQFKRDLPILGVEENKITGAVKNKGVSILGGKQSNAYRDKSIALSVYRDIYGQIYRNFGVTTYKAIKRSQCDLVLDIVRRYEPPLILEERIRNANSQQTIDL